MKILHQGLAKGTQTKAVLAFKKGNYKDAIDIWTAILEKTPNDIPSLKGLACCLFLEDKMREARSYLQDAQSYAMTDPEISNLLALTYLKEGDVQQAISILLDAQELSSHAILNSTLNKIKNLNAPEHAKAMSMIPLIQITLPSTSIIPVKMIEWLIKFRPLIILGIILILLIVFYPYLRNGALSLNIRNRSEISPATNVNIKGIENIINTRENFRIILDEEIIVKKFEELKQAINDQNHNRAKILVNELLASNADLGVKERVDILSSFIIDPSVDNIDYVPKYAEIAIAPAVYEGVMLRWQGTIANLHHQGRKKMTFDLLVNFLGNGQVEGIATVELDGFQEFNNGDQVTVIGPVLGITKDNRIIIEGQKILPH